MCENEDVVLCKLMLAKNYKHDVRKQQTKRCVCKDENDVYVKTMCMWRWCVCEDENVAKICLCWKTTRVKSLFSKYKDTLQAKQVFKMMSRESRWWVVTKMMSRESRWWVVTKMMSRDEDDESWRRWWVVTKMMSRDRDDDEICWNFHISDI
jgi:hypothetical protein